MRRTVLNCMNAVNQPCIRFSKKVVLKAKDVQKYWFSKKISMKKNRTSDSLVEKVKLTPTVSPSPDYHQTAGRITLITSAPLIFSKKLFPSSNLTKLKIIFPSRVPGTQRT